MAKRYQWQYVRLAMSIFGLGVLFRPAVRHIGAADAIEKLLHSSRDGRKLRLEHASSFK